MKKIYKLMIYAVMIISVMTVNIDFANAAAAAAPAKTVSSAAAPAAIKVSPVDVVNAPYKYLNKNITFNAEFVAFSSLGLDYKPAFRDKEKHIGVLIARPDVSDHTVPLSEMKIFMSRELAEKNVDIEAGDKVQITGKVFSAALGDPWMDITAFKLLSQKNKPENKK